MLRPVSALGAGLLLAAGTSACGVLAGASLPDRDVFDYAAQRAARGVTKIAFVADTALHGPHGDHEFLAASVYLARTINAYYPNAYAVVHTKHRWPTDLSGADAVIVLLNHGATSVNEAVSAAVRNGAGFMAVHYGVEVERGRQGDRYLDWLGGYFETHWSVNPWWTPEFDSLPAHEVTRGVRPFSAHDEWYYHMRFVAEMKGVTPILTAIPPLNTIEGGGKTSSERGGNPAVWRAVSAKEQQVMAWTYDRPTGGRGFGFTGLHRYANLANPSFRTLLLNAVAWIAKLDVPAGGVPSEPLDPEELDRLIDESKNAVRSRGL